MSNESKTIQQLVTETIESIAASIVEKGHQVELVNGLITTVDGDEWIAYNMRFDFERSYNGRSVGKLYCSIGSYGKKKLFKTKAALGALDVSAIADYLILRAKENCMELVWKTQREAEKLECRAMNLRLQEKFPRFFQNGTFSAKAGYDSLDPLTLIISGLKEEEWEKVFTVLSDNFKVI